MNMFSGEQISLVVDYPGASRLEKPTMNVYQDGRDISSEVLSGSASFSYNVATFPKLTAPNGGDIVVLLECEVDGEIASKKVYVNVLHGSTPIYSGVRQYSSIATCPYCDTADITPIKSAVPGGMDSCPECGGWL